MIKPIGVNVLNPYINNRGYASDEQKVTRPLTYTGLELSDSKVGRALLASFGPNFKSVTNKNNAPVEITAVLKHDVDSQNKLNLAGLHVYEFPDTNLRLFVHADRNFPVDETPYISVYMDKQEGEKDFVQEKLFHNVLSKRAELTNGEPILTSCPAIFAYTSLNEDDSLSKMSVYFEQFSKPVTEEELNSAKEQLLVFVNSEEYKSEYAFAHKYFNKEKFLTDEELHSRLASINVADFNAFCENYMANSSLNTYVLMSRKDFTGLDVADLAKGLDRKFAKPVKVPMDNYRLQSGHESRIVSDSKQIPGYMSLGFSLNDNDEKKFQTKFLAIDLLSKRFEGQASFYSTIDTLPLTTKTRSKNPYLAMLQVRFKQDNSKSIDEQVFTFRDDLFSVIETEDFTEDLERIKAKRKSALEELFAREDSMPILKHMELARYSDEVFTVSGVIDSISQDDVKGFIKENLIAQMPVVTVR